MYMTEENKHSLPRVVGWMLTLPEDLCVSLGDRGSELEVNIQAWTQEAAARARALSPGLVWSKSYEGEPCGWWEYRAYNKYAECWVRIYAVREDPPTCRIERKMVEVEENVPVAFEKRMVPKEIVEVVCGE